MMKYRAKKRSGSFHLEWVAFFLLSVLTGMIPVGDYGVTSANAAVPIADVQAGGISEKGDLTLRQVLQLVLQNNPELSAFSREIAAHEGTKLQAGLFNNPAGILNAVL